MTVMKRLLLVVAMVYLSMHAFNLFHGDIRSTVLQKDKINVTSNQSASEKNKREILSAFTVLTHMRPDFTISLDPVNKWIKTKTSQCNENFVGYNNLFARLKHVQINPHLSVGRKGGESIEKVIGQPEKSEYMTLKKGYFEMRCHDQGLLYRFKARDHLKLWLSAVKTTNSDHQSMSVNHNFTIAVTRYEYVNLYHTMTDWFNAFLMLVVFRKSPDTSSVLLIDSHPAGDLDGVWNTLFGHVTRAGHLTGTIAYDDLIWGITGYNSPINQHSLSHVPYLEEFREFFLTRFKVLDKRKLNCENLSILFIWRKDYVSHPRNPGGKIKRKIRNEMELQRAVQQTFPSHSVKGLQIDQLPMKEQLDLIVNTDILIGMHGAGLSFTLLLPKHASLIELFPRYQSTKNNHFQAMAKWRSLHYLRWQNRDHQNEFPDFYTYVPIDVVIERVNQTVNQMCERWMRS